MEKSPLSIAIVDDDALGRKTVQRLLELQDCTCETYEGATGFLHSLKTHTPDAVFVDVMMPDISGLELLRRLKDRVPDLPVVMLSGDDSVETVVEAMNAGAYDYIDKPIDKRRLQHILKQISERHRIGDPIKTSIGGMIGDSDPMQHLYFQINRLAGRDTTVLIQGESGSGKELVAQGIHSNSGRSAGPFIAINCAAIASSLQEATLFGHEKGAFTGANETAKGVFERADGGTLFLDEIAELSADLQASLLRVLQEREFVRVGGTKTISSDFRLISASHKHLADERDAGKFRSDLFFRLAVYELAVPPLRDRREDIRALAQHFLKVQGGQEFRFSATAERALIAYDWPGNVRELQNAIERALILVDEKTIEIAHLPKTISENQEVVQTIVHVASESVPMIPLAQLEELAIRQAVEATNNLTEVARILGIGRATLYRKLKSFGLDPKASTNE